MTQLEIQPRELKFVVELNKQSKCAVRLVNTTDSHVAFKVKTTSPKKYCVRPNVGVLEPKAAYEFVVIMQGPKTSPVDLTCKDKFLVQSTIVPAGTGDEDISSEMFAKDSGRYIEESKLRVFLIIPSPSPEPPSFNGMLKQVDEHVEPKIVSSEDMKPVKSQEVDVISDLKLEPIKTVQFEAPKALDPSVVEDFKPLHNNIVDPITVKSEEARAMEPRIQMADDEHRLVKDVEELKFKLQELESKLGKAEGTITKLTEERRLAIQDRESLQTELGFLRRRKVERRVQDGFPLLFVCMVALISLVVGYGFHP